MKKLFFLAALLTAFSCGGGGKVQPEPTPTPTPTPTPAPVTVPPSAAIFDTLPTWMVDLADCFRATLAVSPTRSPAQHVSADTPPYINKVLLASVSSFL